MMRRFVTLMLSVAGLWTGAGGAGEVLEGDLVFVVTPRANAITEVTHGIDNQAIDHVAIVHRIGGDTGPLYVIEAIGRGVCLTPIDSLVSRATGADGVPSLLHGRVNAPSLDARVSTRRALEYVGRPYDDLFMPGDSAIYCSELVTLSMVDRDGRPLLGTIPMSFHDSTGRVTDFWTRYYHSRGLEVPEGEPGSNPGELSRRPAVTILGPWHP